MNASALTYNLEYTYDGKKYHQLDQVWDPTNGTLTKFTYNTTGSVTKIDDSSQPVAQDFFWNEQQQLTGVKNQQGVHHYIYDHTGERIMKSSLINTTVYLNDQVIDDVNNLDPYTVYVNPFYVVTGLLGGDRVSKHYYMNQQRVATDISINYDPSGKGGGQQEHAAAKGSSATETTWSPALTDFNEVLVGLGQKPLDTASLKLPTLASYYPEAATNPATSSSTESASTTTRILFWYHPDYLGNVDLVTEIDGYAHEFFMYNPWGEEMHQWNANTYAFTSPYRFNSKELDPETGLAYYGARYYQNKLGVWLSVDPLATKYPDWAPYVYVYNNPLIYIDPDGREGIVISGSPGNHKNKEHFLVNGLDRAKAAQNRTQRVGEKVTWLVYNDPKGGFTDKQIKNYTKQASKVGIELKVVTSTVEIVDYVNNKTGRDSRFEDKITSFYYVGHATPGDLDVGYGGTGAYLEPGDDFKSSAFESGAWVNLVGGCRTAVKGNLPFEPSLVEQFVKLLDEKSTIHGSDVRVQYSGGVMTDDQLLKENKGRTVTKKGIRK
jgi:RHS repeat-associated protein